MDDLFFPEDDNVIREEKYEGFTLKTSDPFGFWSVHLDKGGMVPAELRGQYTCRDEAIKGIDGYLSKKKLLAKIEVKKNAASSRNDNSKQLHSGSDN